MTLNQEKHFIGGTWRPGTGGGTFPVIDPATEEVLCEAAAGNPGDIERAVAAAVLAQESWGKTSGKERALTLNALAQGLRSESEELATTEVRNNGKPLSEAREDVANAVECFEYYARLAEEIDHRQGESVALPDARFESRIYHEPVGPSALIVPWTFPLLAAAWKIAPALAAGCTAVLKPSELTPLTALHLGRLAHRVDLPPGVLNIVTGLGPYTGGPLVRHSKIRNVAFTGSVPIGCAIMAACAQDIKNVSLHLSGKSPVIVFDDATLDQAVDWVVHGIFWNQGQVCSATSRLLVQANLRAELLERLREKVLALTIGSGLDEAVQVGPLISSDQRETVSQSVAQALHDGAQLLCGGKRPQGLDRGFFYEPTVLLDPPLESAAWTDEILGPVLSVRSFKTESEAIKLANDTTFGLAASVMSSDLAKTDRVARALNAGIVWINCSQPTFPQVPRGGCKDSGIGRDLGEWGLKNYLEPKQVTTCVMPGAAL